MLCSRLARNHPLPDGNKRAAWAALQMFIELNEREWAGASVDDVVETMKAVAAGQLSEEDLAAWIRERLA